MTVAPDSNLVRQIVLRSFAEFSGEEPDDLSLAEMILINEGKYRGRTYRSDGLMAMWLLDVGIVQIYDADGADAADDQSVRRTGFAAPRRLSRDWLRTPSSRPCPACWTSTAAGQARCGRLRSVHSALVSAVGSSRLVSPRRVPRRQFRPTRARARAGRPSLRRRYACSGSSTNTVPASPSPSRRAPARPCSTAPA